MHFDAGTFTAQNNMVRVGLDADGTSTAGASIVRGIYDNGTTAGRNFYHNSVYVGGTQTSGASQHLRLQQHRRDQRPRLPQQHLRQRPQQQRRHRQALRRATTAARPRTPTGLTADNNIFFASGTGGVLGFYNSADHTTLAAWQAATGQDATSAVADPLFVNPTGTAATVDLHLQASNPAEGARRPHRGGHG